MKQIDAETLLDLQDQSLKAQKEELKKVLLKEMADKTGTPHKLLHALTKRDKSELAVKEAQKQLRDIAEGDDDIQDFRSAVGEEITEHERRGVEKMAAAARLATEKLQGVHTSPVSIHAKGIQVAFTPHDRMTQTTREEPASVNTEYAKLTVEERMMLKQLHKEVQERDRQIAKLIEREQTKRLKQSEASSSSSVARNLMPVFGSVAAGISSMFNLHYRQVFMVIHHQLKDKVKDLYREHQLIQFLQ
jgi:hypothetical protein